MLEGTRAAPPKDVNPRWVRGSGGVGLGAWHLAVVDVEGTLRKVCKKVLSDTSMSADGRFQRALALKALGETFLAAVSPENAADGPKKTFRQQLEAFASTMMPPSESAAAAAENADSGGYVGLRVEIHGVVHKPEPLVLPPPSLTAVHPPVSGLVSKPELNGSFGVACGWDPEARVTPPTPPRAPGEERGRGGGRGEGRGLRVA